MSWFVDRSHETPYLTATFKHLCLKKAVESGVSAPYETSPPPIPPFLHFITPAYFVWAPAPILQVSNKTKHLQSNERPIRSPP